MRGGVGGRSLLCAAAAMDSMRMASNARRKAILFID
jgi:hypothetical protein